MKPPSQTLRPTPAEVENQRRFNELRGELLNVRGKAVERWLAATAIILTLFTVIALFAGFVGFSRFSEISQKAEEARNIVADMTQTQERVERWAEFEGQESADADTEPSPAVEGQESADADTEPSPAVEGQESADADTEPSPAVFGEWEPRQPNLVYEATSDGFITAYTGGNNPARGFLIYTGERPDSMPLRTRGGEYDGTVCPVSKGSFWAVRSDGGGRLTVQWLPVGSPQG